MRQFRLVTEDLENRAEPMSRMRVRLDVDVEGLAREALGCDCGLCRRWLDGETGDSGYRDFCPNAIAFDAYRH